MERKENIKMELQEKGCGDQLWMDGPGLFLMAGFSMCVTIPSGSIITVLI
jgi:hypothetical protein